ENLPESLSHFDKKCRDLPFGGRLVEKDLSGRRERLRILPYASGTNYGTSELCRSLDSESREKVRSKEVERQASEGSPPLCNSPFRQGGKRPRGGNLQLQI